VEDNNYYVEACIRDYNGRFVQVFAKKFEGTSSIAEAIQMQCGHNLLCGRQQLPYFCNMLITKIYSTSILFF
jgi:hypothetical protein